MKADWHAVLGTRAVGTEAFARSQLLVRFSGRHYPHIYVETPFAVGYFVNVPAI